VALAAVSLLVYNSLLSFRREVKYVWSRPFRISTVLYFLARYGAIAWSVANAVVNAGYSTNGSCLVLVNLINSLTFLSSLGITGLTFVTTFTVAKKDIRWQLALGVSAVLLQISLAMFIIFPFSCGVVSLFGTLKPDQDVLITLNHFAVILFEGIGLLTILVHTFGIYQTRKSRGTSLVRFLVHRGVFRFGLIFVWSAVDIGLIKIISPLYLSIDLPLQTAISSLILCHFYMDLNSLQDRLTIAESEGMLTTQVVPLPTLQERRPRPQLDGDFDDYLGDGDESIHGDEDDQVERRDDIESKLSNTEGEPQWTPNYAYTQFSDTGSIYEGHAGSEGKIADFVLV